MLRAILLLLRLWDPSLNLVWVGTLRSILAGKYRDTYPLRANSKKGVTFSPVDPPERVGITPNLSLLATYDFWLFSDPKMKTKMKILGLQ
jgi:hypothetical protein